MKKRSVMWIKVSGFIATTVLFLFFWLPLVAAQEVTPTISVTVNKSMVFRLAERAKRVGLATAEIQISETETPLHRLETVYRRLTERLTTATHQPSALRAVIDSWFYTLEEEVLDAGDVDEADAPALAGAMNVLMEQRLAEVARTTPAFAAALRGYRQARSAGDAATAEALIAWLGGQKSVAAGARRAAGVRGDLDHFAALA